MRGHWGRLALFALAIAAPAGCGVIPGYDRPAGFSSSYQRQIYGMDPAPPPIDGGLATIATRPGIFYPETAFNDPPRTVDHGALADRGGPPGPMILGQDPLSPPPKVVKLPDDLGLGL
jgi:hypothetical protein